MSDNRLFRRCTTRSTTIQRSKGNIPPAEIAPISGWYYTQTFPSRLVVISIQKRNQSCYITAEFDLGSYIPQGNFYECEHYDHNLNTPTFQVVNSYSYPHMVIYIKRCTRETRLLVQS